MEFNGSPAEKLGSCVWGNPLKPNCRFERAVKPDQFKDSGLRCLRACVSFVMVGNVSGGLRADLLSPGPEMHRVWILMQTTEYCGFEWPLIWYVLFLNVKAFHDRLGRRHPNQ